MTVLPASDHEDLALHQAAVAGPQSHRRRARAESQPAADESTREGSHARILRKLARRISEASRLEACTSRTVNPLMMPLLAQADHMIRLIRDKVGSGWVVWGKSVDYFLAPHPSKSTFQPWDAGSEDAVSAIRELAKDASFWKGLSTHYSMENTSDVILQDNLCCVKSICECYQKASEHVH